jgi:hypothetical protein
MATQAAFDWRALLIEVLDENIEHDHREIAAAFAAAMPDDTDILRAAVAELAVKRVRDIFGVRARDVHRAAKGENYRTEGMSRRARRGEQMLAERIRRAKVDVDGQSKIMADLTAQDLRWLVASHNAAAQVEKQRAADYSLYLDVVESNGLANLGEASDELLESAFQDTKLVAVAA